MKINIKQGQWWTYNGPGDGKGVKHYVTMIKGGTVTTCSEPSRDPECGGDMWDGPVDVFIQHFKPCQP